MDGLEELEWVPLVNLGSTPSIRAVSAAGILDSKLYLIGGEGSGVGKTSQVWEYNMTESRWSLVICTGDIPDGRDGHTANYIGDGLFVIFGGQGFSKSNLKSDRTGDLTKTKTLCIREVYNDIYYLDIRQKKWTKGNVEGSIFPAGRRGHIAVYLGNTGINNDRKLTNSGHHNINSSSSSSSSSHSNNHNNGSSQKSLKNDLQSPNLDRSLVVFGGSGIEAARGTEILFNDVWVYSRDLNRWSRVFPKGVTPRAMFSHKAELVGDNIVIVGGILGTQKNAVYQKEVMFPSTVVLLNVRTFSWSYIDIYDNYGKPAKLNLQGHSICLDVTTPGCLLIFGGSETIDSRRASLEAGDQNTIRSSSNQERSYFLRLDIEENTVTPITDTVGIPSNRIGHIGISVKPSNELLSFSESNFSSNNFSSNSSVASGLQSNGSVPKQMNFPGQKQKRPPDRENIMFIFGGSNAGQLGGYCDPILQQLVKVRVNQMELLEKMNQLDNSIPSSLGHGVMHNTYHDPNSNSPNSGAKSIHSDNWIDDDDNATQNNSNSLSIWQKRNRSKASSSNSINNENNRSGAGGVSDPASWEDLKLALTYSKTVKTSFVANNSNRNAGGGGGGVGAGISSNNSNANNSSNSMSHNSISNSSIKNKSMTRSNSSLTLPSINNRSSSHASLPRSSSSIDLTSNFVPTSMPSMDFQRLSEKDKYLVKIRSLSENLEPALRGSTKVEAKYKFLQEYPYPNY